MRSSNSNAKMVLSKDVAEKSVLEYQPLRFDLGTPEQAVQYLVEKKKGSDFRLSDVVREQTGVQEIEQQSEAERIEVAALDKLKEIQEQAYKSAYEMGLEEGRAEAFRKTSAEIDDKLQNFQLLIDNVVNLKSELVTFNEAHIMQLIFQMASRIAKKEVQTDTEPLVNMIREAVTMAQSEETVTCMVAPEQLEFLETLQKETAREFEFLKKVKLEPNPEITAGGCVVQTNYGEVDARVEQRITQLWQSLSEALPKVKPVVVAS